MRPKCPGVGWGTGVATGPRGRFLGALLGHDTGEVDPSGPLRRNI